MPKVECIIKVYIDYEKIFPKNKKLPLDNRLLVSQLKHKFLKAIIFKEKEDAEVMLGIINGIKNMECRFVEK